MKKKFSQRKKGSTQECGFCQIKQRAVFTTQNAFGC